jgi:hypothetical protein
MEDRPSKRVIRIAALLACALLVVIATRLLRRSGSTEQQTPQGVTAISLGVTNAENGRRFAIFQLTNGTRTEVGFLIEAFEQLAPGESNQWTRTTLRGAGRSWINEWSGALKNMLAPGSTYTFAAPPPVTNAAWRIVFRCFERQALRDRSRELVLGFTNSSARNDRVFSGRNYQVITPDVAPSP